jgi:general secretion pathway protein D
MKRLALLIVAILMLALPLAAQEAGPGGITFDFQEADLRHVITALAEAGGLNVVFAGLPQRPVTLRTNRPVPRAEVLELLRSVAEGNGLRLVDQGGVYRVEPAAASAPMQRGPEPQGDIRLFVHRLKHAQAVRVSATLQSLFGTGGAPGFAGLTRPPLSQELRAHQVPPVVPVAPPQVHVDLAPAPSGPAQQLRGRIEGEVQIVPDELTNSLLIRASERDWLVIREAIEALDLRPLQVLIEVLIAEVRRGAGSEIGVSAQAGPVRDSQTGTLLQGELAGATAGDFVLRIMEIGPISADVVISALSSRAHVEILSRPVILAQNNQEARIMVGSQRPFIQVFRALPTDAAVRDQVVQYRDVGTALTIRPTINQDGYVTLELVQEVSTATTETQFGAPVISTREASTQLLVRDRQTVVIGGLIDQQTERSRRGVPVLKDIPLLGFLFGTTERNRIHTELFLLLTPHIIRDDADADALREGVRDGSRLIPDRAFDRPSIMPSP